MPIRARDVEAETFRVDLVSGCDECPCAPFALTLLAAPGPPDTDDLYGVEPGCLEGIDPDGVARAGKHLLNLAAAEQDRESAKG